MKNVNLVKVAIAALLLIPASSNAADRVGDFSLLDQDGYHHSMSWYDDHKMIALLVQANDSQAAADWVVTASADSTASYGMPGLASARKP